MKEVRIDVYDFSNGVNKFKVLRIPIIMKGIDEFDKLKSSGI